MVNDMTWRKLPRDLQTNENFTYIESKLKPELAAAPYMFYITALRLADDDGIFDLEDGIIFSRLMKIGTPDDVFIIANYMQIRRIITRVSAESNRCFLNDWDYPKTQKPRTMAERRSIVMRQIEEEKAQKNPIQNAFTVHDQQKAAINTIDSSELYNNPSEPVQVNFSKASPAADFFCIEDDKQAENVVMNVNDDKNAENVVKKNETEREKERETLERLENLDKTHTENGLRTSCQALQPAEETAALAEIDEQDNEIQREEVVNNDPSELASMALAENADEVKEIETLLNDWFVRNCYGYKPNAGRKPINELAKRITALASEMNPPDVVANVMLKEFKTMSEKDAHWQGIPLLPAYLVKEGVYSHVMARASRILLSNAEQKKIWAEQLSLYEEKDHEAIGDGINEEYLRYGIDPNDPNRTLLLLQAKKSMQGGTSA